MLGREDAGWKGLLLQRTAKAPGLRKVEGRHVVGEVGGHEVSQAAQSGGRCVQAAHRTAGVAANAKVDDGAAKEGPARLGVRVLDDRLHGERLGGHGALVPDHREESRLDVARQPGKLGVGVVDDEHGREGRHDRPVGDRQNLEGQLARVLLQQTFPAGAVELEIDVGQGVREDGLGVLDVRGGERLLGEDLGDERGPGTDHLVILPSTRRKENTAHRE